LAPDVTSRDRGDPQRNTERSRVGVEEEDWKSGDPQRNTERSRVGVEEEDWKSGSKTKVNKGQRTTDSRKDHAYTETPNTSRDPHPETPAVVKRTESSGDLHQTRDPHPETPATTKSTESSGDLHQTKTRIADQAGYQEGRLHQKPNKKERRKPKTSNNTERYTTKSKANHQVHIDLHRSQREHTLHQKDRRKKK
jgi:hypothetical protein